MIVPVALIIGFAIGWLIAARRGGSRADKWQYGIAYAFAFSIGGLVLGALAFNLGLVGTA